MSSIYDDTTLEVEQKPAKLSFHLPDNGLMINDSTLLEEETTANSEKHIKEVFDRNVGQEEIKPKVVQRPIKKARPIQKKLPRNAKQLESVYGNEGSIVLINSFEPQSEELLNSIKELTEDIESG